MRPSPVPSPAGFVRKERVEHLSFTSPDAVPLSRMRISTLLPRFLVVAPSRAQSPNDRSPSCVGDGIESIGDQIQEDAGDFLWKHFGRAGARIKVSLQSDIEFRFFGARTVIREIEALINSALMSAADGHRNPRANAATYS